MTGIERLRSMAARHNFLEPEEARLLDAIADQIERETEEQSARLYDERVGEETGVCELFGVEPVDDPLTSLRRHVENLNDTIENLRLELGEQSDAIAWVREHGGIEHVRQQWGYLRGRANHADHVDRQLVKRQRQIDESHAALRRRNERIGFLVSELNRANHENREMFMRRAGDYTAFADEVCKRLASELRYVEGCSKDVMDAALHALDRRLMPVGMGWPRFEDGEPVRFGDVVSDGDETGRVYYVTFDTVNPVIIGFTDETPDQDPGTWLEVSVSDGERVKRPAPKVLDADGAEIRVGDTVWATNGHGPFEVTRIVNADRLRVVCDDEKNGHLNVYPKNITHRAPVLAADGRPLREGETVWFTDNGENKLTVTKIVMLKDGASVYVRDETDDDEYVGVSPSQLTHERPAVDTWERLEEDAKNENPVLYCKKRGIDCEDMPPVQAIRVDLVRRAKALAERDA